MKLLDKIQRDIDEIAEFGYCNYAETFITLIEARERIEELEASDEIYRNWINQLKEKQKQSNESIDDKLFALIKEGKRDTPEYEKLVKQKGHQSK